jgi:hypothetical protein
LQIQVFLSVISGEEAIHPAHASLHEVMRKIWNDPAGFSPEFRPIITSGITTGTSGTF